MRGHFWLLPFAASLMFSGTAGTAEPAELIVPEIINAAPQLSEKGVIPLAHSFGFSPFMEEDLALDLPGTNSRKYPQMIIPAYLREFSATSD